MAIRCPICGGETFYQENPFRPFCSERCKLIDLDNWLSERYGIPVKAENGTETPAAGMPVRGNEEAGG